MLRLFTIIITVMFFLGCVDKDEIELTSVEGLWFLKEAKAEIVGFSENLEREYSYTATSSDMKGLFSFEDDTIVYADASYDYRMHYTFPIDTVIDSHVWYLFGNGGRYTYQPASRILEITFSKRDSNWNYYNVTEKWKVHFPAEDSMVLWGGLQSNESGARQLTLSKNR